MSAQVQDITPQSPPRGGTPELSLDDAIERIRQHFGVPKTVVDRMVTQESGGSDAAESYLGAHGRFQVEPGTLRLIEQKTGKKLDINNPLDNAYAGLWLLKNNYDQVRPRAKSERHAWMMSVAGYHGPLENVLTDLKNGGDGIPDQGDGLINTRDHVFNIFSGTKPEDFAPAGKPQEVLTPPTTLTPEDEEVDRTPFTKTQAEAQPSMPPLKSSPAPDLQTEEGRQQRDIGQAMESQPNARILMDIGLPPGKEDWTQVSGNELARIATARGAAQRGVPSGFIEGWLKEHGQSLKLYNLQTGKEEEPIDLIGTPSYDEERRTMRVHQESVLVKQLVDDYKLAQLRSIPGYEDIKSLQDVPETLRALTVEDRSPGEKFLAATTPVVTTGLKAADYASRPFKAIDAAFWSKLKGADNVKSVAVALNAFTGGDPEEGRSLIAEALKHSDRLKEINPRLPALLGGAAEMLLQPSNLIPLEGLGILAKSGKLGKAAEAMGEAGRSAGLLERGLVESRPLGIVEGLSEFRTPTLRPTGNVGEAVDTFTGRIFRNGEPTPTKIVNGKRIYAPDVEFDMRASSQPFGARRDYPQGIAPPKKGVLREGETYDPFSGRIFKQGQPTLYRVQDGERIYGGSLSPIGETARRPGALPRFADIHTPEELSVMDTFALEREMKRASQRPAKGTAKNRREALSEYATQIQNELARRKQFIEGKGVRFESLTPVDPLYESHMREYYETHGGTGAGKPETLQPLKTERGTSNAGQTFRQTEATREAHRGELREEGSVGQNREVAGVGDRQLPEGGEEKGQVTNRLPSDPYYDFYYSAEGQNASPRDPRLKAPEGAREAFEQKVSDSLQDGHAYRDSQGRVWRARLKDGAWDVREVQANGQLGGEPLQLTRLTGAEDLGEFKDYKPLTRYESAIARNPSHYGVEGEQAPSEQEAFTTFKGEYEAERNSLAQDEARLASEKLDEVARRNLTRDISNSKVRLSEMADQAEELFGERAKEITGEQAKREGVGLEGQKVEARQAEVEQPGGTSKVLGQGEAGAGEKRGGFSDLASTARNVRAAQEQFFRDRGVDGLKAAAELSDAEKSRLQGEWSRVKDEYMARFSTTRAEATSPQVQERAKVEKSDTRKAYDDLVAQSNAAHEESVRLAREHTDKGAYNRAVERAHRLAREAQEHLRQLPEAEQKDLRGRALTDMVGAMFGIKDASEGWASAEKPESFVRSVPLDETALAEFEQNTKLNVRQVAEQVMREEGFDDPTLADNVEAKVANAYKTDKAFRKQMNSSDPRQAFKEYVRMMVVGEGERARKAERIAYSPAVQDAFKAWNENRVYVDNAGNYHLRPEAATPTHKQTGPVAPWNREVKRAFKDPAEFHAAAQVSGGSNTAEPSVVGGEVRGGGSPESINVLTGERVEPGREGERGALGLNKPQKPLAPMSAAQKQVLANVGMDAQKPTITQRLRAAAQGQPAGEFKTTAFDRLTAAAQDSLRPLMKAISQSRAVRGISLRPENNPETLTRLVEGSRGKFEQIMDTGPVDARNRPARGIGGGVNWLLEPFDHSSKAALENDMQDAVTLMVSERTIEKAKAIQARADAIKAKWNPTSSVKGRARTQAAADRLKTRISGIGGGSSDEAVANQVIRDLATDPARYAKAQEGAKRYRAWADATLRYWVEKGRLSQDAYNQIKASNQYYAAMQRVMETGDVSTLERGGGKRLGSVSQPVKKFKGSTREIDNPYTNLLKVTHDMYREADRNEALKAFRDLIAPQTGETPTQRQFLNTVGRRLSKQDKTPGAITIYVNGEPERWKFEKGIESALKNWGEVSDPNIITKILEMPAKITRYSVTHSPDFMVRNIIRDAVNRGVISETGSRPLDILKPSSASELESFKLAGGENAGYYFSDRTSYHKELGRRMAELSDDKGTILDIPGRLKHAWEEFAGQSEQIGRMAEYRSAFKKAKGLGYDDYNASLYAASKARDLLDFAKGGTVVKEINRFIPFTNAAMQGLTRTVRGAVEHPKPFLAKWTAYVLAPTVLTYSWNAASGALDEYRQLPAWQRDFFWNFKVGNNKWVRIPKPFEMGVLASSVERLIDRVAGNPNAFEGYGGSVARSTLPVDESAFAGPFRSVVESVANYDFFRGQEIVPKYEEDKALDLRAGTQHASRIGQAVQKILSVDARKVDHVIQSLTGGLGRAGLVASDIGREDRNLQPAQALNAVTGLFTTSPATGAVDVKKAFDLAEELGLSESSLMKPLRQLQASYFNAKTEEERDLRAEAMRKTASRLIKVLEARRPQVKMRFDNKQNAKGKQGAALPPPP